jgi:hypothetical protein
MHAARVPDGLKSSIPHGCKCVGVMMLQIWPNFHVTAAKDALQLDHSKNVSAACRAEIAIVERCYDAQHCQRLS